MVQTGLIALDKTTARNICTDLLDADYYWQLKEHEASNDRVRKDIQARRERIQKRYWDLFNASI